MFLETTFTFKEDSGDFCNGLEDDPNCIGGCGSKYANSKGDGSCDDENNYCGCDWDGGDCCGNNVDTRYCKTCECLDPNYIQQPTTTAAPCTGTCGNPNWKGDI